MSAYPAIEEMKSQFQSELAELGNQPTLREVEDFKIKFLGKKGLITGLMKQMGSISNEERPAFGKEVNILKKEADESIKSLLAAAEEAKLAAELAAGYEDVSLPGNGIMAGALHPLNVVRDQIIDFFRGLGFAVERGREVETDFYNFEALNIPWDHPARDSHDTFYVDQDVVLRTQTSNVQIHVMQNQTPPIRMIAPGHVYRVDSDATHAPMFQQVEGLVVDENITFAQLKGMLFLWAKDLFGENTNLRFRPHFFPFTEPSAEMDITCFQCGGKGCRKCSNTGWMEIGGCGSVDPAVFEKVGLDPEKYTGFAFGFGIDRITMVKYKIPEIGLLTGNDNRFLKQF